MKFADEYAPRTWFIVITTLVASALIILWALKTGKKPPLPQLPLVIDDCIVEANARSIVTLDYRVRNPGTAPIQISRVLLKVLGCEEGVPMVSAMEVSDSTQLNLDESVKTGEVLEASIALTVPPMQPDRFVVKLGWLGEKPMITRYYVIVPALRTSIGYVRGKAFRHWIQEDFTKEGHGIRLPQGSLQPPWGGVMTEQQADETPINWEEEAQNARRLSK